MAIYKFGFILLSILHLGFCKTIRLTPEQNKTTINFVDDAMTLTPEQKQTIINFVDDAIKNENWRYLCFGIQDIEDIYGKNTNDSFFLKYTYGKIGEKKCDEEEKKFTRNLVDVAIKNENWNTVKS